MLQDVLSRVNDYGIGEVLTVAFFLAFIAIVLHTLLRPRREVEHDARLPLNDDNKR